jgi:hypothetical protein
MEIPQGHAARTCGKNMKQEHTACICSMDMKLGKAWKSSMDKGRGHADLYFKDMQQGHKIQP